jgi:hypothetical protein
MDGIGAGGAMRERLLNKVEAKRILDCDDAKLYWFEVTRRLRVSKWFGSELYYSEDIAKILKEEAKNATERSGTKRADRPAAKGGSRQATGGSSE